MNKLLIALCFLIAMPLVSIAAENPASGTESGPQGAGPPGYQSWPGHTMSMKEQAPQKHIAAAAAHEQAATHHKAAAAAIQDGETSRAKEHALAAEQTSSEANAKSKEATGSGQSNEAGGIR